jgi:hypothetical protein
VIEFQEWPKIARLFRDITITEKIDGTNAAIIVKPVEEDNEFSSIIIDSGNPHFGMRMACGWTKGGPYLARFVEIEEGSFLVGAQSRKQLITPEADNFGFAKWVYEHSGPLAAMLGTGRHFGEWWGSGIQRGYGLPKGEKRFSLFNVHRYGEMVHDWEPTINAELDGAVDVVPTLYHGIFDTDIVNNTVDELREHGSWAAPGFMRPEGIIIHHSAGNDLYKVTVENDGVPKGLA